MDIASKLRQSLFKGAILKACLGGRNLLKAFSTSEIFENG
jgi:hypothetical protein